MNGLGLPIVPLSEAATIGAALATAAAQLAAAGVPDARREARLIVALALGVTPETVLGWPERAVLEGRSGVLAGLVARRAKGEPLSRLRGAREFWSLDFTLSSGTLDPRPDSETLVTSALCDLADRTAPLKVLDFGTGSGCLLLALLSELPNAHGIGIDLAPDAVATASRNAAALGLASRAQFWEGDWRSRVAGIVGQADVILANPPYIPSDEIAGLAREVAGYEPHAALDGGPDGLDAYRSLGPTIHLALAPRGRAYVEIGAGQALHVMRVLTNAGISVVEARRDLSGIERCLIGTLKQLP